MVDCGCRIKQEFSKSSTWAGPEKVFTIVYCPKHKAAPELYEALKNLYEAGWSSDKHEARLGARIALDMVDKEVNNV